MLDIAVLVGDALLAGGGIVAAKIGLTKIGEVKDVGETNTRHLEQLADPRREDKIREVVYEYAREHPGLIADAVATDALRDLLDAFIAANLGEPYPRESRERRYPRM